MGEEVGLVLWDVDGTLVRTAGAGALAFLDAVEEVLGIRPPDDSGSFMAGMTDPQIALELLRRLAAPDPYACVGAVLAALEPALARLAGQIATAGWVCPGVPEVLVGLAEEPSVAQTLLTGNLAANARLKLSALGLGDGIEYDIGAYGSDHHDRCQLVPIALDRLAATGRRAHPSRSWVVGDTPRDLECARAGGVQCLLVATGGYAYEELAPLGAEMVLRDLSDVDSVVALLSGRR